MESTRRGGVWSLVSQAKILILVRGSIFGIVDPTLCLLAFVSLGSFLSRYGTGPASWCDPRLSTFVLPCTLFLQCGEIAIETENRELKQEMIPANR